MLIVCVLRGSRRLILCWTTAKIDRKKWKKNKQQMNFQVDFGKFYILQLKLVRFCGFGYHKGRPVAYCWKSSRNNRFTVTQNSFNYSLSTNNFLVSRFDWPSILIGTKLVVFFISLFVCVCVCGAGSNSLPSTTSTHAASGKRVSFRSNQQPTPDWTPHTTFRDGVTATGMAMKICNK